MNVAGLDFEEFSAIFDDIVDPYLRERQTDVKQVAERLLKQLTGQPGHQPPPPTANLDLIAANRWQLEDAGLKPRNISASNLCTACNVASLFSYRAEHGNTGRLLGAIALRP